jgi:cystathionine beta-lyase/cystathionine gamma-synthase
VKNEEWWKGLFDDRTNIGFVMGNMESWLTVRSMRTFELRLSRQSENTTKIVDWFYDCLHSKSSPYSQDFESDSSLVKLLVDDILHSSIQAKDPANSWIAKQMPNGHGPVFAVHLKTPELAKRFPSLLHLFQHATSLGGVESLVEWRAMSDETVDRRLIRFSIGVEDARDLIEDVRQALHKLKAFV